MDATLAAFSVELTAGERGAVAALAGENGQIALVSNRDAEICVMSADGTGQAPLTDNPAADFGPDWGPVHYDFIEQRLDILTYPRFQQIDRDSETPVDVLWSRTSAEDSGLPYDVMTGQYTYVWRTGASWDGSCRQLVPKLDDATDHRANFEFN